MFKSCRRRNMVILVPCSDNVAWSLEALSSDRAIRLCCGQSNTSAYEQSTNGQANMLRVRCLHH